MPEPWLARARGGPRPMMSGWHPGTKFLLLAGLVAVPYLWWTTSDPPRPAAPVVRAAADPGGTAPPPGALEPYALPPLERFAAVVERPLFSPTRRMPPIEEAPPEVEEAPPEVVEAPAGPEEPELRFFGTVRQGGRALALVTFPATNAVARLGPGDRVGEWEVTQVEPNRLVLAIGEERREFEIFGAGSRSAPESAPGRAPGPESADGESLDGELPPDELPPDELSVDGELPADDELPVDGEPSLEEPPLEEPPLEEGPVE